jgi:isoleucyl-tRNA synthetase
MDDDKHAAYHTLYEVMSIYLKLLAPFAPFTTEYLWKILQDFSKTGKKEQSIHLEYRPLQGSKYINAELMSEIETVRTIIKQALFVRAKNQIKVKIPLRKMEVKIS